MELIAPVRVVVVDDNAEHLFAIANALSVAGIPCVWHLYDNESHNLLPKPPAQGYDGIRLIITDLNIRNFTDADPDPKKLGATLIEEVLTQILPANAVPYGLVLWSSVTDVVNDVSTYIRERIDHESLEQRDRRSAPLSTQLMKKGDFISNLISEKPSIRDLITTAAAGIDQVKAELEKALSDPQLRLVCAWETRACKAATSTTNTIFDASSLRVHESLLQEDKAKHVSQSEALKQVLAKIANESVGKENAKEDAARALDDGLVDLFVDDLRSQEDSDGYQGIVAAGLGDAVGKRVHLGPSVRELLNTSLHVEKQRSILEKRVSRGLVLGAEDEDIIATLLGRPPARKIPWSEFLFTVDQFESASKRAREEQDQGWEDLVKLAERAKAEKADVEKACRLRLVEIGADCDHANRKDRTVRMLCALEVPERYYYFLTRPGTHSGKKSDALTIFGPWTLGDRKNTYLVVSIGRFTIGQNWSIPDGLQPKYRLRRPIVDSLLHAYASHSSRIGYVAMTE